MIAFLKGTIELKTPTKIEVNVNGVGYELIISLNTYDNLPDEGSDVKILVHDYIKEDARVLYGFMKEDEREMFRLLIQVNRVGPKAALSILSRLSPAKIRNAIVNDDVSSIAKVSGIGRKTAERIIVDLREKIRKTSFVEKKIVGVGEMDLLDDAVNALEQLGYKRNTAYDVCSKILKEEKCSLEDLVRKALRRIS